MQRSLPALPRSMICICFERRICALQNVLRNSFSENKNPTFLAQSRLRDSKGWQPRCNRAALIPSHELTLPYGASAWPRVPSTRRLRASPMRVTKVSTLYFGSRRRDCELVTLSKFDA